MAVKRPTASSTLAYQALRSSLAGSNSCRIDSHNLAAVGNLAREPALPAPMLLVLLPSGMSWPAARGGMTGRALGVTAPPAKPRPMGLLPLAPSAVATLSSSESSAAAAASNSTRSIRQVSPCKSSVVLFPRTTSCVEIDMVRSPLATPGRVPEVVRHFYQSLKLIKDDSGTEPSARASANVLSLPDTCLGAAPAAVTGTAPAAAMLRNRIRKRSQPYFPEQPPAAKHDGRPLKHHGAAPSLDAAAAHNERSRRKRRLSPN